jgi:hypothetical protein
MRKTLLSLLVVVGCGGGGGGSDDDGTDAGVDAAVDAPKQPTCALPEATADTGNLAATKAQQCNVPGTMGAKKWYRLAATLPGAPMDFVQVELWDARGVFGTGAVAAGTYQITGAELNPATCGVCVRGLGDKGSGTQKEYFATAGTVQVTSIGGAGTAASVTLTNITFQEVDAAKLPVTGGCSAAVTRAKVDGTIVIVGGGSGGCPGTVGD